MPSVRKRGSKWSAILWDRTAKEQTWRTLPATIRTKRDAIKVANRLQDDLDRGRLGLPKLQPDSGTGWLDVAGKVIDEVELTAKTAWARRCEIFAERFQDFLGDIPVADITEDQCRDYQLSRLRDGASPSLVRKEAVFLSRVLRRGGNNAFQNVKRPSEPMQPPHFMSAEQFGDLMRAAPPDRAFRYQVLVYTGARMGEAQAIKWGDIDFAGGVIRIKNSAKGAGPRHPYRQVPICAQLRGALKARRGADHKPLFDSKWNWRRNLLVDCKAAGIGHWRIHDLRHTFASWLAQAGISLHQIRDLLGHQSITMTERYAYLLPAVDKRVARALDAQHSNSIARAKVIEIIPGA